MQSMNTEIKNKFRDYLLNEKTLNTASVKAYIRHINYLYEEASMEILSLKNYASVAALIRSVKQKRKGKKDEVWKDVMAAKTADMATVYYTWAWREGLIEKNPMQFGHEFNKGPSPEPRYLENPKEILDKLRKHPFHNVRDECTYRLLLASGIRRKEYCELNIKDVDCEAGFVKVSDGKGGQYRMAYIDQETAGFLKDYINGLKLIHYTGNALFFTERFERLKPDTLTKWLIRRSNQLGLHISPHMFRHTVGRNMRKNGAPLEDIADVLGHKSLSSTRIYSTLGSEEIKKRYDKYHKLPA